MNVYIGFKTKATGYKYKLTYSILSFVSVLEITPPASYSLQVAAKVIIFTISSAAFVGTLYVIKSQESPSYLAHATIALE